MHILGLCLPLLLTLSLAPPRPEAKVWTNDDLQQIPVAEAYATAQETTPAPAEAAPAVEEAAPAVEVQYIRAQDPEAYRKRLAAVEEELAQISAQTTRIQQYLRNPRDNSDPGIVLGAPNMQFTPENELKQLTERRRVLQQQIADIQDEAQHNRIVPGAIR